MSARFTNRLVFGAAGGTARRRSPPAAAGRGLFGGTLLQAL